MSGGYKKVPAFWWDYVHADGEISHIVIESDHPKYPVVCTLRAENWMLAENTIAKLNRGLLDFRKLAKQEAK